MYLLATRQSYFSLHLPPKTRFPEYGRLLLIGQFKERNAELEWVAVSGEDRCVTTLITAAREIIFKPEQFENAWFLFSRGQKAFWKKAEIFENDVDTIIMSFLWPSFLQAATNPKWPVIATFSPAFLFDIPDGGGILAAETTKETFFSNSQGQNRSLFSVKQLWTATGVRVGGGERGATARPPPPPSNYGNNVIFRAKLLWFHRRS